MEPLPVAKIVAALPAAKAAARADGWFAAANAIMTTDTVPKGASRRVTVDGVPVTVTGIAKGAGMIHPDMATMLSFIATDAPIAAPLLAQIVREVADVSFNGATVDGDTSTNDSFVLAATGRAKLGADRRGRRRAARCRSAARSRSARSSSRRRSCATARAPPSSSRSASRAGASVDECRRVAFGIAHSPLVKTAFFASDPNLGRIVCAIGNTAAPDIDPARVSFWLDDVLVVDRGGRAASYREEDGQRVMKQDEIAVRVDLGRGTAAATVWTCDFSHDYVTINADYRS